jgi:hypothetical protein
MTTSPARAAPWCRNACGDRAYPADCSIVNFSAGDMINLCRPHADDSTGMATISSGRLCGFAMAGEPPIDQPGESVRRESD